MEFHSVVVFFVVICAHCLVFWAPLKRTWLHLLCTFSSGIWSPWASSPGWTLPHLSPLIWKMLQLLLHLCGPLLDSLGCVLVFLVSSTAPSTQICHQRWAERRSHLPELGCSAGGWWLASFWGFIAVFWSAQCPPGKQRSTVLKWLSKGSSQRPFDSSFMPVS